jgi:hypothetical protein
MSGAEESDEKWDVKIDGEGRCVWAVRGGSGGGSGGGGKRTTGQEIGR